METWTSFRVAAKPEAGNPSFQELLEVPLIVAPATQRNPKELMRTEDVNRLLVELAGGTAPPSELAPGELLLAETHFRTYLAGRWKSVVRRKDGMFTLFDLQADPEEKRNVAKANSEIVAVHRDRIEVLSKQFSAREAVLQRISPLDLSRLRLLGYQ